MLRPGLARARRAVRQLVLERDARKRRVSWALLGHGTRVALAGLGRALFRRAAPDPITTYSRKPTWYES
jgi:hypothetical protein